MPVLLKHGLVYKQHYSLSQTGPIDENEQDSTD